MKLKVLSYNIHKGFDGLGTNFVLHEIKRAMQVTHADIVLLQEVVGENQILANTEELWPTEAQFEFLADSVWTHFSYGKNAVFPERHHGNAILSKYPIKFSENINISNNKWEQRGLLHCELEIPAFLPKTLHVFNVHLDLFHGGRKKQLHKIIQRAQSHVPKFMPFILGGDFNDWNQGLSGELYEFLGVHESFKTHQGEHAKSFPNFLPFLRLDRMYYKHLTISHTETLNRKPWTGLSDHLPIFVEFDIQD